MSLSWPSNMLSEINFLYVFRKACFRYLFPARLSSYCTQLPFSSLWIKIWNTTSSNFSRDDRDGLLAFVLEYPSQLHVLLWLALQHRRWRWIQRSAENALGKNVDTNQHTSCIPSEFPCSEFPNINTINFVSVFGPTSKPRVRALFVSFLPSCPDLATSVSHLETGRLLLFLPLFIPFTNLSFSQCMTLTTDMTKDVSPCRNPFIYPGRCG